jgi:rhamnogalacturonan endolyase
MSNKRYFTMLGGFLLIGFQFLLAPTTISAQAAASSCVTETSTSITATNSLVSFTLNTSTGNITSIQRSGKELLGNGGSAYWDMNDSAAGLFQLGGQDLSHTSYAVQCLNSGKTIDVSISHKGSTAEPMGIVQHYILQQGEAGIHLFTVMSHSSSLPADTIAQFRFLMRGDPTIFTNASVEDDPIGTPFRQQASTFPTPQELASAPMVQDATYDLQGLNSAYPRRYYTKYDWSVYYQNHVLHGFYGHGYGAWLTMDHNESFNGGPTHQDLTVHQTTSTPALLDMEQSAHFGGPQPTISGNWTKIYGPYFLYLNTGTNATTLRNDALQYAKVSWDQSFYDSLGIPGYATSNQRTTVTGKVTLSTKVSMAGSTVVLSDSGTSFQNTWDGYQYWASLNADGTFSIPNVRPATYRLSVYRSGYFDDFHVDNVVVKSGSTFKVPAYVWIPQTFGQQLWQIGTPDRLSAEFRNGSNFRAYGNQLLFPHQFPNGVNFIVGKSSASFDWNYVQYQQINGQNQPDWNIQFNMATQPKTGSTATLTVALAGWSLGVPGTSTQPGSLTVIVNGTKLPAWVFPLSAVDSSSYRSGASGDYHLDRIQFNTATLLKTGTNILSFRINDGSTTAINNVEYDALRFDVN